MTPSALTDGSATIEHLDKTVFAEKSRPPRFTGATKPRPPLADDVVIARMKAAKNGPAITKLLEGDTSAHGGDDSAADLALMNALAFWTARNADQMERIFGASALAHRDKWQNRKDYRDRTIAVAIQSCREVYDPRRNDTLADIARNLTDVGNGARFAIQHGDRLRYCHTRTMWMYWDESRWCWDYSGRVIALAIQTALSIFDEAKTEPDDARRAALSKWAVASQKRDRIAAMLAMAQHEMTIGVADLDANPWMLNCVNGVVDLHSGALLPHSPANFITRMSGAEYNPDAKCPRWLAVLDRAFASDALLIAYFQRLSGVFLTADVTVQEFWVAHGEGNNGKSVILDTLIGVMGDYAGIAPESLVATRHSEEHPTDLAGMAGRRLIVASETEAGSTLRLQLIKRMTGDATLRARYMRCDYFDFARTFKLILVTNNRPRVPENSEAAWRRVRLIPFTVIVPPEERDPQLLQKLRDEWPGILAWAVQGCLAWQRDGLGAPPAVLAATAEYRADQDTIGEFLAEQCAAEPNAVAFASDLYLEYQRFAESAGEHPVSQRRFGSALASRGFSSERCTRTNRRAWGGIRLKRYPTCQISRANRSVKLA